MARDITNPDSKEVEFEGGLPRRADEMENEAVVEALLEANGGEIEQKEIVQRTGWSDAKVSLLLGDMEADGDVERTRIGRKNIVEEVQKGPIAAAEEDDVFRCVYCGVSRDEQHKKDCPQRELP